MDLVNISTRKVVVIFFIICFIFICMPFIIYYKVVKPVEPTFAVDHASVHGFNITSNGHLTAFFNVGLRVDNQNHILKLKYRSIRVSVYKDKQNLATDSFPGFTQRKQNVTVLNVKPVALNVPLKKGPLFNFGVESGMGYINFDVFMTSYLDGRNLEVDCKGIMVNLTDAALASSKFEGKFCSVLVYRNNDDY